MIINVYISSVTLQENICNYDQLKKHKTLSFFIKLPVILIQILTEKRRIKTSKLMALILTE